LDRSSVEEFSLRLKALYLGEVIVRHWALRSLQTMIRREKLAYSALRPCTEVKSL